MRGMCITDFSGPSQYMDSLVDGLIAGSDIWDSLMPKIHTTKAANYENDAYIVTSHAQCDAPHPVHRRQLQRHERLGCHQYPQDVTPWWQTAIYAPHRSAGRSDHPVRMAADQGPQGKKSMAIPLPQRPEEFRETANCYNQNPAAPRRPGGGCRFLSQKGAHRKWAKTAKASGVNRAKPYQLVLFPLNNGATNVYYVLVLSYIATFGSKVLALSMIFRLGHGHGMRLFDAITDPIIGALMDRTNGKFGKFRPFMVIGNLIMAASILVLYCLTPLIPATMMWARYAAFVACTQSGSSATPSRPAAPAPARPF